MADGILIVGGYGAVGSVIATALAEHHCDQLIIAGRNGTRATSFAQKLGAEVRVRVIDVEKPIDYNAVLADVQHVVMCLDLPQIDFVRQCLQRGIHYIDVSAEYATLSAITGLHDIARQHRATAILSVGLIPGLSNLMARHSLDVVHSIDEFDSAVLLGLGEKHGAAATLWTLNHLSDTSGSTRIRFPAPYGERTVHRFAFSDQYTLPQTLPIAKASTWLCFDSALMTHLIGFARLPLIRNLLQREAVKQFSLNLLQRWQVGSDDFVLTTRARRGEKIYQAWLAGKSEADITGLVAAEVVHRLVIQPREAGVYHIEQLFELKEFLPLLAQHGVTFSSINS